MKRHVVAPTDEWAQLHLLATSPEQVTYDLIRPHPHAGTRLFGRSPGERARETGTPERTLDRQADRFDQRGLASLFTPAKGEQHRRIPQEIRAALLALKAEHPPFHARELVDICAVRFDRRLSHHTVKRILAEGPLPASLRRFPPYHAIADPSECRLAVIRLHAEGWRVTTIAAYLEVDRKTVSTVLKRWVVEGVARLDDKPPRRPAGRPDRGGGRARRRASPISAGPCPLPVRTAPATRVTSAA